VFQATDTYAFALDISPVPPDGSHSSNEFLFNFEPDGQVEANIIPQATPIS
jgi:hypothetical protein